MSTNSVAGIDAAELMTHTEELNLLHRNHKTDTDGRIFYIGAFVSSPANENRCWRWQLLRSGDELYTFDIESLSGCSITLSSLTLYGSTHGPWVVLTEKQNIGQPTYQSGDFSVAYSMPGFDKPFTRNKGYSIYLKSEGRMVLTWTSAVVKQLIRYIYLNNVDGDVCQFLPDILDTAQMWELVGLKPLIEAQMSERLQKTARDADTDTAAEYLKMAHLHGLTSLVPLCNKVLADNFDRFFDSESCKQMIISSEFAHLIKAVIYHKCNTHMIG